MKRKALPIISFVTPTFLFILFCSNVGLVSASAFTYSNFSSIAGLNLVGHAAQEGNVLRVGPSLENNAGAAWHNIKHNVANGFETIFEFQISELAQTNFGEVGGDGFTFAIQNTSSSAVGTAGFYMGYEIDNSLVVEFDTFYNSWWSTAPGMEPNNNHVGVQSSGASTNTASYNAATTGAYIGSQAVGPDMSNGAVHTAKIVYAPGTLSIFVDDLINEALIVSVNLAALLNLDGGTDAYVGFTAGGDTAIENHDILSWSFTSTSAIPEPTTLALMGLGLAGIGYRRHRSKKAA